MKRTLALAAVAALACCAAPSPPFLPPSQSPALVSAQSPPAAESSRGEPQSLNSLPPGAANVSPAPNATHPNYLSLGIRAF